MSEEVKVSRECPHCHGSLERYEDPVAVEIINQRDTKIAALEAEEGEFERQLSALQKGSGFCDKHKPDGGARNCLVCGCEELSHALDRISYAVGEPNEMGVSNYSTHYDEEDVVGAVKAKIEKLRTQNRELREMCKVKDEALRDLLNHGCSIPHPTTGEEIQHQANPAAAEQALALQPEK